jgi:tetratricopeptide (TPR) repeat protein
LTGLAYDAFISYSHSADGELAPALQRALHRFAKPWWKMRAVTVFRDGTSLAAAHDLSEAITTALAASRFFIFLAAPGASASKWCQREVVTWIRDHPPETLLIVLTEGAIRWDESAGDFDWSVTNALPRSLSGVFNAEPLWIDLSWAKSGDQVTAQDPRFHQAVAMLAARLHGRSLDEIAGEDVRQHRRTRVVARAAAAGLVALTLSSIAGAFLAVQGQRRAERNLEHALAATDTLVTEVAEGMRNFYGVPRPQLEAILTRVEAILATLAAAEDSPTILDHRVALMTTLARANIELGNLDRAAELARQAEALIVATAERDGPASTGWRRLAALQLQMVDIAHRRSDYAAAAERSLRYRRMSEATRDALTATAPAQARSAALHQVVVAIERQAGVAADQGRLDDALLLAHEAVTAADAFLAAIPDDPTARLLAAAERSRLAELLASLGRPDDAIADLDAARKALLEMDASSPNRLDVLTALVRLDQTRAMIFQLRDRWSDASLVYENLVRVLDQLHRADRRNVAILVDYATVRRDLAHAYEQLDLFDQARGEYRMAAALFAEALGISPDSIATILAATRALQLEAKFLEGRGERDAAQERLDRAVELGDALVRQRGASDAAALIGVVIRTARARLAILDGRVKTAVDDLEHAERRLADLGRPGALNDLVAAIDAMAGLVTQWRHAGRIEYARALVGDALAFYALPPGVSAAAAVDFRVSMASLASLKATAALDAGDPAGAVRIAAEVVASFESEIVPHSRRGPVLDAYARQLVELGRVASLAGDNARAREAYCAIGPNLARLGTTPRLALATLDGEFLCAQARYFAGDREEGEKLLAGLAERVDAAVPVDGGLMAQWRSLRARVAALRAIMRVIAGDTPRALALTRLAIDRYHDAARVPAPDAADLTSLAVLQGQLAGLLKDTGDPAGAREAAEAAVKTWRRAGDIDRSAHEPDIRLAEAVIAAGDLWRDESAEKALSRYEEATAILVSLRAKVPEGKRRLVLAPLARALSSAGDAAYALKRIDDAVARHRQALQVALDLAALAPRDVEVQLDLARQHARLARSLHGARLYAEAREQCGHARRLLTLHQAGARDSAVVERLISWVERLLASIAEDETAAKQPGTGTN